MTHTAEAGTVRVINQSGDNIKVNIVPGVEGVPYCWKCFDSCLDACGKSTAELLVPVEAFGKCTSFSVVDTEDGIWGNGKCKNLNVFKNYEVVFSNTSLGTKCISKEII